MTRTPIQRVLQPLKNLLQNESTGGILLVIASVIALVWSNTSFADSYHHLWETELTISIGDWTLGETLHHWINDGLMAMFFFVVGLELKREFISGELSTVKKALLPMVSALGGMLVPAFIYFLFNKDTAAVHGWGIPMATDIAFALGILAMLGKRVPLSIKVFLTALAIADDLGAVLVIAFFYTSDISVYNLISGGIFLLILVGANLAGVRNSWFYAFVGIAGVWLAFLLSGVHATIAGVLAALTIPTRTSISRNKYLAGLRDLLHKFRRVKHEEDNPLITSEQLDVLESIKELTQAAETPSQRIEYALYPWVFYLILPIFALANAGVELSASTSQYLNDPVAFGVFLGLLAGKPLGIFLFTLIMIKFGWAKLPSGSNWLQLFAVSIFGGIGFTMSLFISELAFAATAHHIEAAKIGILGASVVAGVIGFMIFRWFSPQPAAPQIAED